MSQQQQQDDLALLDRVLFRLASAEDDAQLESALHKYLPSCLLKLDSGREGVRKKVMELLVHINKRVKDNAKVQLPMEALLAQYADPEASSFVANFTVIYVKMGFPRMNQDRRADLIPSILAALEKKPPSHQDAIILMLIPDLQHFKVTCDMSEKNLIHGC